MLIMVEKGIRGGICNELIDMQKLIINIWKIMIEIKNHHMQNIVM